MENENENPTTDQVVAKGIEKDRLKAVGLDGAFNTIAELQNAVVQAQQTQKSVEAIVNLAPVLEKATSQLAEGINRVITHEAAKDIREKELDLTSAQIERLELLRETDKKAFDRECAAIIRDHGTEHALATALQPNSVAKSFARMAPHSDPDTDPADIALQQAGDMAILMAKVANPSAMQQTANWAHDYADPAAAHKAFRKALEGLSDKMAGARSLLKMLDNTTATLGDEWTPPSTSGGLLAEIYLEAPVMAGFTRIDMPTATYKRPIRTARPGVRRMPQGSADADLLTVIPKVSDMKTAEIQFDAEKLALFQIFTAEHLEDNILFDTMMEAYAMIPHAFSYGLDDAAINGSTSLSDQDNASTDTNRLWANTLDAGDGIRGNLGARDVRNSWDGIRKTTPSGAKFSVAAPTTGDDILTAILNTFKKMDKYYGANPADVRLLASTAGYLNMFKIPQLQTLEKYGPKAVIHSGEVGKIAGSTVIQTPHVYSNLNASGVFDNVTTNLTEFVAVHRLAYIFAVRRAMLVDWIRSPHSDMFSLLATMRCDFQKAFAAAEKVSAVGYNMTT